MKAPEMQIIAELMVDVLQNTDNSALIKHTKKKVRELCDAFPLYGNGSGAAG
jgi:glycine/serine hydroxymethyltransferase